MYRGTTPTFHLYLDTDLDKDLLEAMWVTFKAPAAEVTKDFMDGDISVTIQEGGEYDGQWHVVCQLTQEESLDFYKGSIEVQVRFRLSNGKAYATNIPRVDIEKILKEGVI